MKVPPLSLYGQNNNMSNLNFALVRRPCPINQSTSSENLAPDSNRIQIMESVRATKIEEFIALTETA
jgi:hypothetical protein